MKPGGRRRAYIALGILISLLFLLLLFWKIDFRELGKALREANYLWLAPNIAFIVFSMYQRAYRWQSMLRPIKSVGFDKLLAATCIGFMANNVLPLRLGEFVRAYSLSSQDRDISKSASLATIFVERMVFDLVTLLAIFGFVLGWSHLAIHDDMRTGLFISVAVALIGILFVLVLAVRPSQSGDLLARYLFFAPTSAKEKVRDIVMRFSRGLEFIKDARLLGWILVQTAVIWVLMAVSNYFVFKAFGFDLPISASFVLLVVVSIAILVPSSPGFVGVYHAGTVWALMQYPGIGKEQALSFALVLHAAQYIPITAMGFYYLRKEHLSLKNLEEQAVDDSN